MSVNSYDELREHIGHQIACVCYGKGENPDNVSIECEDCNVVLVDFDKEEPSQGMINSFGADTGVDADSEGV